MASTTLLLGLAGGFAALYYIVNSQRDTIPLPTSESKGKRNVNWVYTEYAYNINSPLNVKNRFTKNGTASAVVRGANEQDLISWNNGYEVSQIYRVPSAW